MPARAKGSAFDVIDGGLTRQALPQDGPREADAEDEGEDEDGNPGVEGGIVEREHAPVVHHPKDKGEKGDKQDDAEKAEGTEGGADVDEVAKAKEKAKKEGDGQVGGEIGLRPCGEVSWGGIVGEGEEQECAQPADENGHGTPFGISGQSWRELRSEG